MSTETRIEAGHELDVLVAEEVMGWTHDRKRAHQVSDGDDWKWVTGWRLGNEEWLHEFPPAYYSTSYEGMGLVLERMKTLGWGMHLDSIAVRTDWSADFMAFGQPNAPRVFASAPTLPHAVALAALAAVRAVKE